MLEACVIGFPIHHSLSPIIHKYWLKKFAIDGNYTKKSIKPEEIADFLQNLPQSGLRGCNITLPYKSDAFMACQHLSDAAQKIKAVNTIFVKNGQLYGDNSDWWGFNENLLHQPEFHKIKRDCALVLGAGGAARGVVYGLKQLGFKRIIICNRSLNKKQEFLTDFPYCEFDDIANCMAYKNCDFIVNTTSAELNNQEIPIDFRQFPNKPLVHDIVYKPLITQFLRKAQDAGCNIIDGLGMLLYQAIVGFNGWFQPPSAPIVDDELRANILQKINHKPKIIGVTGSIAMGKSACCNYIGQLGYKVSDADAMVHELLNDKNSQAYKEIAMEFAECLDEARAISRPKLGAIVFENPEKLAQLEAILHPKLQQLRQKFIQEHWYDEIIFLNVPLLFEKNIHRECDKIIVVSTTSAIQKTRVMARNTMTLAKFAQILAKQMPDKEKRALADYIVDTSTSFADMHQQILNIIEQIKNA